MNRELWIFTLAVSALLVCFGLTFALGVHSASHTYVPALEVANPSPCNESRGKDGDGEEISGPVSDLCQQWRMAEAANKQIEALNLNNKIVAAEAVLLILTFALTLYVAQQGARTTQIELRAYVGVQDYYLTVFSETTKARASWVTKNNGHTSANRLRHWGNIEIFPYPLPDKTTLPTKNYTLSESFVVSGGDVKSIMHANRLFSRQEIDAVRGGLTHRIYIFGCIEYFDVFNKRHITQICVSAVPSSNLEKFLNPDNSEEVYLEFEHTPKHNLAT